MATHYEVLGVQPGAGAGELRSAYVAKARALHPDRHLSAPPAERRRVERAMQEVNVAWTVLSDPRARRDYDASLRRREEPAFARPAFVRIAPGLETTATLKLKKAPLRETGWDRARCPDPLYVRDDARGCFVPLTTEAEAAVRSGALRL